MMISTRKLLAVAIAVVMSQSAAIAGIGNNEIRLEPYLGSTVQVRAVVNGTNGLFLFDTGEGVSSVTPNFAKKIGCAPWGQISMFQMNGKRIDMKRCDDARLTVGTISRPMPALGVFDLMSLLPQGAPTLDGSLGLDAFEGSVITLDQAHGQIVIETASSLPLRTAKMVEVPVRIVRDAEGLALTVNVGVKTTKGMAWMELDSGNFGPFVVGKHLAPVLGMNPREPQEQGVTLHIGGRVYAKGTAEVKDLIMDGNIGERFLHDRPLTLDLRTNRAWIAMPQESK